MKSILALILLSFFCLTTQAGVFKCKINGVTTYHNNPCGNEKSKLDIKVDSAEKSSERAQIRSDRMQAKADAEAARIQAINEENNRRYAAMQAQAAVDQTATLNKINKKRDLQNPLKRAELVA